MTATSPLNDRPRRRRSGDDGATIAEAVIGAAIAIIGVTGLCVANGNCLKIARAHRELIVADACLQQRTEQYCAATWTQITDAEGVRTLLGQPLSANAAALENHAERITVAAYPPVTPAVTPIVVTLPDGGAATVVTQPPAGFNLRNVTAVRIDFQETWTSAQGRRPRTRETSTVISLGGLFH